MVVPSFLWDFPLLNSANNLARWEAGGFFAVGGLPQAYGVAGFVAYQAIGTAHVVTLGDEPLLHLFYG